jgi:RNA polymerase sigma-70 factor (ECF subfamily)
VDSRQEAEDLTQDVFFQVYKSIRTFRFQSRISTWIYRIAVNLSLNYLNKKRRMKSIHSEDESSQVLDRSAPDKERPDRLFEQKEKEEIIRKAILSLPKQQQTALILQRYEGLSTKEIADVMDTSVSSVEARLFRAKANLGKKLMKYFES